MKFYRNSKTQIPKFKQSLIFKFQTKDFMIGVSDLFGFWVLVLGI